MEGHDLRLQQMSEAKDSCDTFRVAWCSHGGNCIGIYDKLSNKEYTFEGAQLEIGNSILQGSVPSVSGRVAYVNFFCSEFESSDIINLNVHHDWKSKNNSSSFQRFTAFLTVL